MVTRYEAYMDGIPLSSIAPEIIVKDIAEKEAKINNDTYMMASGIGSRYLRMARESLTVSVKFEIHAYDVFRRQDIMEQINMWAKGQYLSLNTRPGKRLSVLLETGAVIPSALKWTQDITLNFVARAVPYWEAETPARLVLTGTEENGILRPPGAFYYCPVEFTVKNTGSGSMSVFSASVGEFTMSFENLSLMPDETFSVTYVDGIQILPVENRTPESADNLMAICGEPNTVSFTTDQTAVVTFTARGRFD